MSALVLIVDDQPKNLDILVNYLANAGLELMIATDGKQALDLAAARVPDLVVLDIMMPGMDGYQVCSKLKQHAATAATPVIFMSALSDIASKVKGFKVGAIDFITKPFQREEVVARIQAQILIRQQQLELQNKNNELEALNRALQEQINRREEAEQALHLADERLSTLTKQEAKHWGIDAFIGQSTSTQELLEEVRSLQMAANTNVLVLGESGTGKELISRAIHYGSERSAQPFIAVNCSAIPADLADAEFFGHTKGAYTGATSDRHGYFVQADGGTLFLDEIGDMPLGLQAKLLRVLEDGVVTPIGGRQSRKVNVRVVAATNVELAAKVSDKKFRQDLFFRLAGYQIALPPLRQRRGDIELLTQHFLQKLGSQMGRDKPQMTREALQAMGRYHFPGNVRELKNIVEYALIASRGATIEFKHLHFLEPMIAEQEPLDDYNNFSGPEPRHEVPVEQLVASAASLSTVSQEDLILQQAAQLGRVDNTSVQQFLKVDHGRASYLLKKLHKEGKLNKQGQRRWTHYTLI
ncbi:MAG: sigma-54-dependent Fis family transcriptional regulator [Gammaproteobacteria bacterium]|nr:sigma-54-dependent Fis family transcriptional regulator [Gammaproteobacteria bacterium]